jgi:hypothetical protein
MQQPWPLPGESSHPHCPISQAANYLKNKKAHVIFAQDGKLMEAEASRARVIISNGLADGCRGLT